MNSLPELAELDQPEEPRPLARWKLLLLLTLPIAVAVGLIALVPSSWPTVRIVVLIWLGFLTLGFAGSVAENLKAPRRRIGRTERRRLGLPLDEPRVSLWQRAKGEDEEAGNIMLLMFVHGAVLAGAVFGAASLFAFERVRVVVDNGTTMRVRIAVDGEDWLSVAPGESVDTKLRAARHEVVVFGADGQRVDSLTIDANPPGPYVFNVLGKREYIRETVWFAAQTWQSRNLPGPKQETIRDTWFDANVTYLFEPMPSSIEIKARPGQAQTMKTHLYRKP